MEELVTLKLNPKFWREVMGDEALAAQLRDKADEIASAADAACGQGKNQARFKNRENFVAKVVTRQGKSSAYPVGLVIAANPRSIYKAQKHGILKP